MHTPLAIASEARELKPAHQAILPWLDMLRQLCPPSALLLVGAGSGSSPWVQYLMATGHRNVTLIEADETTANRLKIATQEHPDWTVKSHVVGRHSAPTPFYTASLQTESGLLEPESLRSLWPNLKTTHKQTREAIALAELQEDAETPANWLMVDCLPALPIIRGAAQQLAAFDVIALRVLLNDNALPASAPGASADELQTTLQALGFRCLAIETSRHPAIGQALFVRDTAAAARHLQQQLAQQTQTLAQAKATSNRLAAERQKLDGQLQLLKATAEKSKTAAAQATQQAQTAAEAQAAAAKQAEERAAQVQQLTQAKAAADKLATERQQHIDQLQGQVKQSTEQAQAAALEAEKAQAAAATAAASTAAATKQAEERAAQVQQLTQAKAAAEKLAAERQQQVDQLVHAKSAAEKLATERLVLIEQLNEQIGQAVKTAEQLPGEWKMFADTISQRMAGSEKTLAELCQQLAPEQLPQLLSNALEETLLKQAGTHKDQLKEVETHLRSDLNKGLANAVKQVEAFISIQNYLSTGDSISDFHGWPISPDIGLFLLEKIKERQYDLIIEFGSGTSTLLFAKALAVDTRNNRSPASATNNQLSKRIISFEHDATYHHKTRQLLQANELGEQVNLILSPLVDWSDGENKFLYYGCEEVLEQVAGLLKDEVKKVLVLVDGPPSAICINARYPAVPHIFNKLGKHHIDVVLDDANRPEEKAVVELWRVFWKKRSIHITEKTIASEKGIFLASNYE